VWVLVKLLKLVSLSKTWSALRLGSRGSAKSGISGAVKSTGPQGAQNKALNPDEICRGG
jgi:hypothetical protein